MSKARKHLEAVRSDLAQMRTNSVQARIIISFCDDGGVPQHKNRFFIVTPRVGRQVEIAGRKQDRSLLHPDCDRWNWVPDAKKGPNWIKELRGSANIRIRLQHIDVEDSYDVGCRCQADPSGKIKTPGKSPFCTSRDMITARRWTQNGIEEMACLQAECPLRYRHQDAKGREFTPAKTEFVLVGVLDEEGLPPLLVSTMTGSDYNLAQFDGLIEKVTAQWHQLCHPPQVPVEQHIDIPLSWYDIPILLTVYESSDAGGRYPRVHYTLGCSLEEVFERMQAFVTRMRGHTANLLHAGVAPLQLTAGAMTEDFRDLDADEVLHPEIPEPPAPGTHNAAGTTRIATAAAAARQTVDVPPDPPKAPEQPAAPTLLELCQDPSAPVTKLLPQVREADDRGAAVVLLKTSLDRIERTPDDKKPAFIAAACKAWLPHAGWLLEYYPSLEPLFALIDIHPAQPKEEPKEEPTPFEEVMEEATKPAPAPSKAPLSTDPVERMRQKLEAVKTMPEFYACQAEFNLMTAPQKKALLPDVTAARDRAKAAG